MKILKFGGSSVASAENIKKVTQIIFDSLKQREGLVVVVSALGGVTDNLIKLAILAEEKNNTYEELMKDLMAQHDQVIKELVSIKNHGRIYAQVEQKYTELAKTLRGVSLLGELSPRSLDKIMSFGEQLSAYIISETIKSRRISCEFVDASSLIKTDSNFGSANVEIQKTYELISNHFKSNTGLSIMGGFIASTNEGVLTTLGRGGSDYTASLVGAAINASVIEIWTDVDGVLTADPRKVSTAFPLIKISYEEAGELAHFGAKVIHPKTMRPARLRNIPIDIKNTFNPQGSGTKISNEKTKQNFPITGISSLNNVSLLHIQSSNGKNIGEIAARIFNTLSRSDIEILLTTQASHEQALSIAINDKQAEKARVAIEKDFVLELKANQILPILLERNLSIVAIVGKQMKGIPGISGRLFSTLGNNKINVIAIAQGSSELNVSAVIESKDEERALQIIHKVFFEQNEKNINLFLVGTGLIGKTLLKQIKESGASINICGMANIDNMLIGNRSISLQNWEQALSQGKPASLQEFIRATIELNLPNSVLVDCTASEEIVTMYENVMKAGIAIITPNKKANSGSFKQYNTLKNVAQKNNVPFIYETNVGAGLPIIRTIQNLIASGDEIIKIEAVLSGTLSYIFNTFSESNNTFSQITHDAKTKGYTEPDPRNDLSGMDVARKILILAREIGLKLELNQVKINPILPTRCFGVDSVDDFFIELKKLNNNFEEKKIRAQQENKAIRYIATLQNKKAEIALQTVDPKHPFYSLSGSDNIIAITTKRYNNTPLIIRGPGAGAEVTAGGVLANIISILK